MKKSNTNHRNIPNKVSSKGIIKLSLLLIAVTILNISIFAQTKTVSISLKDTTVEAIIDEIRIQTDQDFIYNHEELKKCPKVSVTVVNASIEEALKLGLKNTGMTFKKVNNTLVIVPVKESALPQEKPKGLTQTLRGTVIDRDSKVTLPFANVVIVNSNPLKGTITDMDGNFKFEELPVGRHSVKASFMGYEDAILSEVLVGSAKEVVVTIEITEKLQELGDFVVSAKKGEPLNQMATVSAKSFSVEETKRYAASISDPARMAQAFAGVSTGDDASNEIVIRGNSPNWLLWRLEGIEIPSPNHFAEEGYVGGAVSILSSNMIGKSDFYTGAFPAEFGDALSGVFDIKLRQGNNQENEFVVQAGLLGVDLSAEGPFKKGYNGSFLFNYRYSTLSLLNDLNIKVSENTLPEYQDLSFKFHLPTKKAGTFSVWAIGGLSESDEKYLPDTTIEGQNFFDGYTDYTKHGMYAAGVSHTFFPDQKSYFKTVVAQTLSYSSETWNLMDSSGVLHDRLFDKLQNKAVRLNSYYNRKISSRLTTRTGITLNNLNYDYLSQDADSNYNLVDNIKGKGSTNLIQAYLQTKYKFSDNVIFTAGLHYAHFALSKDNSIEPRLGLQFNLKNNQKLSFGYGMHSKNENLPIYFMENLDENGIAHRQNKDLQMTRSTHYIASYEKRISTNLNLKIETYLQNINKLPVSINPDELWAPILSGTAPGDTLQNTGKARNYGVEFTLQRFFADDYYFMVTSSLFDSKYMPADGEWHNTKYNIKYVNNFIAGKEFKWGENKLIGLNSKILWSGGKRMIPIDLEASIEEGEGVYKMDELYSAQGPDYFRIDLGVRVHFFKEKTEHVISLDIQNVTNRLNTWSQIYDRVNEKIIDYPMAGLIPVLNYRIEF